MGKATYCRDGGRTFHALLPTIRREQLDALALWPRVSASLRSPTKGWLFCAPAVERARMLYFTQPSTRTFLSFCAASRYSG